MKRIAAVAAIAFLSLSLGLVRHTQKPSAYRVVFDLTSRDTLEQRAVLRWLREVSGSSPDAQMEVVMYGKGFELVMPDRSPYANDVKEAMKNPNVSFKVCAIALKNNNVDKSQLLSGVSTVPDGIHEIVMKQQADWGYIKVMH
jgi:intracellular sulfur oxidation DsrE/DsrF family protein